MSQVEKNRAGIRPLGGGTQSPPLLSGVWGLRGPLMVGCDAAGFKALWGLEVWNVKALATRRQRMPVPYGFN